LKVFFIEVFVFESRILDQTVIFTYSVPDSLSMQFLAFLAFLAMKVDFHPKARIIASRFGAPKVAADVRRL